MYSKDFYITDPVGNNAFSYDSRPHKELYIPALKKIKSFDEIKLLQKNETKITFEEYDFNEKMQTCFGLENLYELGYHLPRKTSPSIPLLKGEGSKTIPLYLVDNHNHVHYFWYLARSQGIISDNSLLYHIDEHADTRDPGEYLLKPDSEDLQKVFHYTNFTLNVGNYIIPAEKEGLIGETIQIRAEEALREYLKPHPNSLLRGERASCSEKNILHLSWQERIERGVVGNRSIILNLDLDFFEPELDYIDYNLKKQIILDIAQKADLITVCTSPYFINQRRALEVFKDIFFH